MFKEVRSYLQRFHSVFWSLSVCENLTGAILACKQIMNLSDSIH